MTFNQLSYFLEVYSLKSIKNTADKLMISAQGLSKTIILLEKELGVVLFDRSGPQLTPTHEADELYLHAYQIISEYQLITKKELFSGEEVTLYAADSILQYFIPGFLKAFSLQFPMVTLNISTVTCRTAGELLKKGKQGQGGELALLLKKYDKPGYDNIYLASYDFCLVVNNESVLAKKDAVYAKDWDTLPIAGRGCGDCNTRCMDVELSDVYDQGYVPKVKVRTTDEKLCMMLAKDNVAAAYVSRPAAMANMSNDVKIMEFGDRDIWCHMYLTYLSNVPLSHSAILIRQFLVSWCANNCKKLDRMQ